jgi:TolB-like protein/Flp pilus assembly protein TadD
VDTAVAAVERLPALRLHNGMVIGTRFGHYLILERIGAGGMGEVFKARDTRLDRLVALKVLAGRQAADPQHRARFAREARAIAALKHPNIVTVYSVEEEGETAFITMELVDGRRLADLIPPNGMALADLAAVAAPLVAAVAEAHAHGIVHRDLKPENVMIEKGGTVKVLDFGLAKLSTAEADVEPPASQRPATLTGAGMIFGTASYMSPEQAEGRPVDARSDVFSLGIVLYQMATGRRPFQGDSEVSILSAVLRDTPPPVGELRPDLPAAFSRLVEHCLAKDPAGRFADAGELAALLAAPEVGTPSAAGPDGGIRRRRVLAVVAAAAFVLLAAAAGWLLTQPRGGAAPAGGGVSIAVLPFANLSADPDSGYFSDGITEEITTKLAHIGGLRVASRTAAARYRASDLGPRAIARELGVDYLLEGSVRRAGDRVKIAAQLVAADTGFQAWSREFEGDMRDVFRLQEDTALEIAAALDLRLSPREQQAVRRRSTTNAQAFDAYLRGRSLLEYFDTPDRLAVARAHLERALQLDPGYPLALVGLSRVEAQYYRNLDPRPERLVRAEELARRALERDPELAEAHVALAQVHGNRYEYGEAAERCREAIRLDAANAYAWDLLSWALAYRQPPDAAGAEEAARRAITLQASLIGAYYHLGRALVLQQRHAEALQAFEQAKSLDPGFETADFGIAQVHLATGDPAAALAALARLRTTAGAPVVLALRASAHAAAGDAGTALAALDEALAVGYHDEAALRASPHLATLRADPRYAVLLRTHGLAP